MKKKKKYAKKEYYIYQGTLDGEVVYIGKGSGDRYKHLTSGKSSCKEANRAYFQCEFFPDTEMVKVEIIKTYKTERAALNNERKLIEKHKPKWNILYSIRGSNFQAKKCQNEP